MSKFCDFLTKYDNILYLYNGPDTVGDDTEQEIAMWLTENNLDEETLLDIDFHDKGYAFFRN
jgi:hypothetical protein